MKQLLIGAEMHVFIMEHAVNRMSSLSHTANRVSSLSQQQMKLSIMPLYRYRLIQYRYAYLPRPMH